MATRSQTPPFFEELYRGDRLAYQQAVYRRQPLVNGPLQAVVDRCLAAAPSTRYQSFEELRSDLERLLSRQTGETISRPELEALEAWEWNNRGVSLDSLRQHEEAIHCYDKALKLGPRTAAAWYNKGNSLFRLGRYEEAVRCYDEALELDPGYRPAWVNRGTSLHFLNQPEEAGRCYEKAEELEQQGADTSHIKGLPQKNPGPRLDPRQSYKQFIALTPGEFVVQYAYDLREHEEAIRCQDKTLELDPRNARAWYAKALAQDRLGRKVDAVQSYKQCIALAPAEDAKWVEYARQRIRELVGA
jgi:tetratricopeptide (TPR) repeat protein